MKNFHLKNILSFVMVTTLVLSNITPFTVPVQAAVNVAPVTADWNKSYQTMDGVGAAYAYSNSLMLLQLGQAGHQDTVQHLLDLAYSSKNGTGHDIVRVIIGDNGLTTTGATATSPGFNPVTGLMADVKNPGFDVEGNEIPMKGTAGQYGYKNPTDNRFANGNTDSIWPVEPEHAPGTLVPADKFIWDYPSWNEPMAGDDGGPTSTVDGSGNPVVIKNSPRTKKELFDIDQVWTMKQAMKYGVQQFYACMWEAPYWMSSSPTNTVSKIIRTDTAEVDGRTVKIYYQAYADYLVNYIRGMWEQFGIPITQINPYNELDLASSDVNLVKEQIDEYIGPSLKKALEPGGVLDGIKNPDGKIIDFVPQLVALDGCNLGGAIKMGGNAFSETDPANVIDKNKYLDIFSTHLYGTVGIGTDEKVLTHTGDFAKAPLDYNTAGAKYPEYLTKYKLWQTEFMNQDTRDGSAGAYTQRYGNQNINDAVRYANLMTNMFTSNPGFNAYIWWSMWDNNNADGSDLIRLATSNSDQAAGHVSTLTGEYRAFKRFYGFGHFSRFMNPGDIRFDVTRAPANNLNIVGFKSADNKDFSITVTNGNNDDSIQPLEFSLNSFPVGTKSVTVFRTSGSENQKKLDTIPVTDGKFIIDIPSASIVTIVPSEGTYATYDGLDSERDIFSSLEAEGNDNSVPGSAEGNAGRANEAVKLSKQEYLAYKNVNFADGSANGGVVRRHLLYLNAQAKSDTSGSLLAYVLPVGTAVSNTTDIITKGTKVAEIYVPINSQYGKYQDMVDTGDLSAYGHKDLYIVAGTNDSSIIVDRFLFGANDSDWSDSNNNSTVSITGNLLTNGDFETATAASTDNWSAGRYDNGKFIRTVTKSKLSSSTIQRYSGYSRYLKNGTTSKDAASGKLSGRIDEAGKYDGLWQDVTGKLVKGEKYNFEGYFLTLKDGPLSYEIAADKPGDVEAALIYYDNKGNQLAMTSIGGRDIPEPYAARDGADPAWFNGDDFVGQLLGGAPLGVNNWQANDVKVADWHESTSDTFTYNEPSGTTMVALALFAKDSNIFYVDQLSITPAVLPSYNIFIDGVQLPNFDLEKSDYSYTIPGNYIPKITVTSSDKDETAIISQATSPQGTAVVRFIKGDTIRTYRIIFTSTEVVSFADGLPTAWEIINPSEPNAITYGTSGDVTITSYKGDTDYPSSHDMLQLPGSAEGNWTLTTKITVDKALNDSTLADNSQVGLGIQASSGEFYSINVRKVNTNIKVNSSGKTDSTTFTNNINQINLTGINYYLRLEKSGDKVQGYFSMNNGLNWFPLGNASTYTPDFFKIAKVQLYATNLSTTDFKATFTNVTLLKSLGETGEIDANQNAVEDATLLLQKALSKKDFYHFNLAYQKITTLSDEKLKAEMLDTLSKIHDIVWSSDIIYINDMLNKLAKTASGKIYDDIQVTINTANISAIDKEYLLGEVSSWGTKIVFTDGYKEAVDAVVNAWNKLDAASVSKAEVAISKVSNAYSKEYLLQELAKIKAKIK